MNRPLLLASFALACALVPTSLGGCGDDDGTSTSGSPSGGETCTPTDPVCSRGDCIALDDNTGKSKYVLRMAQLTITSPSVLALPAVGGPSGLVTLAIRQNLEQCQLKGQGTFNWLMEVDEQNLILRTGGAKPVTDPLQGYCFDEKSYDVDGVPFTVPIEVPITLSGGAFTTEVIEDLVVPIYTTAAATSETLLPLHQVRLSNAKVSADKNCVGSYNDENLDPDNLCGAEDGIPAFHDDGTLDGFIGLEEADGVIVEALGSTLCTLLTPDTESGGVCERDGNGDIVFKGDWCSTSNSAATADCADAMRLSATFAASAAKLSASCP